MIYGYCRISTIKQSLIRQERNIHFSFPNAVIFKETFTGTSSARPIWKRLNNKLKSGDIVVFDSVSRMSRNATEGIELYMQLFDKGIELVFLKEPHVNTSTYKQALSSGIELVGNDIADIYITATNKVLRLLAARQIELAFEQSEKEVSDLRQRTKEGIETARLNGKQIGGTKGKRLNIKKEAPAKELIKKHSKSFGGTLSDQECIKLANISRNTYYKYKKELKSE
ncbi:recombinase family protein [Ruminococcus sp. XPD3002]|uniref:recombinase family protein n=1 Tax=Ruminococcus sp. XPD3002 TaxID=1452269 RepID=UPI00091C8EE0|nr:Site-specific DNA recombinase [Ruminococcus flavefaciens]